MNKKFITRSLAAAAVSFAAKLIVKKIQKKSSALEADAKNSKSEDKPEMEASETNVYLHTVPQSDDACVVS